MKSVEEIRSNFEQILNEVIRIQGLPVESATQVAAVILQESGKFERTEMLKMHTSIFFNFDERGKLLL